MRTWKLLVLAESMQMYNSFGEMTEASTDQLNELIKRHTVLVGRSHSWCFNCGRNYIGGKVCPDCGTVLAYSATYSAPSPFDFAAEKADMEAVFPELEYLGIAGGGSFPGDFRILGRPS